MKDKITKKDILKLLRKHTKNLSASPNIWRVVSFNKHRIVKGDPEEFDVEVRFQHTSYISLVRDLYNADIYGNIPDGVFRDSDFSFVPHLKIIITQLEKDGYLYINKQNCKYHTDVGMEVEFDESGAHEIYLDAKEFFSSEERESLETSIILSTKGQNKFDFLIDKIFSEPIGFVSLFISLISLFISIFK